VQIVDPNANVAEHNTPKEKWQNKGKGKVGPQNTQKLKKKSGENTSKFTGTCYKCGKEGHKSFECRSKKDSNKNEANLTQEDMCAVGTEANVAESHPMTWWFDTNATRHICLDRSMFSSYVKNKSEEKLFMGNSATSKIEGYGKVILKFRHMRKNLVSGSLLSKHGFAVKIDADKLVITKKGMYLGNGFVCDGLFN